MAHPNVYTMEFNNLWLPFLNKLEYYLGNDYILPNTQFGFRKGKSCIDNILILTTDIILSLEMNTTE